MKIKDKLYNYLVKNPGKEFTNIALAEAVKVATKSSSAQLPKLEKTNPHVHKRKADSGNGFLYWFQTSKKKSPVKKDKPEKKPSPGSLLPDALPSLDGGLGEIVARIVRAEQQTQMYQQALGQIASILEQCGFVESD